MPDTSAGSVAAAVAVATAAASLPGSANPLPPGAPDTRRASTGDKGLPYYEKIRKDLRDMILRKRYMDKQLAAVEDQIAKFEAAYLDETSHGNIIRGFDNYIKGPAARRRNAIGDADRVFSMSSATSLRAAQQEAEATSSQSQSASASTLSTNQTDQKPPLPKKKTIKRRKGEDGSESPSDVETPGLKRVRISFSRQPT